MRTGFVVLCLAGCGGASQQPVKVDVYSMQGTLQRTVNGTVSVPDDAWQREAPGSVVVTPHPPAIDEELAALATAAPEPDTQVAVTIGSYGCGSLGFGTRKAGPDRADLEAAFDIDSTDAKTQAALAMLYEAIGAR